MCVFVCERERERERASERASITLISVIFVFQHIANPKADEWSKFVRTLQEMKQQATERDEDSNLLGSAAPIR